MTTTTIGTKYIFTEFQAIPDLPLVKYKNDIISSHHSKRINHLTLHKKTARSPVALTNSHRTSHICILHMHPHLIQSPTPRIYNFPSTNCNDAVRMRNVQNTYYPRAAAFEPLSRLLPYRSTVSYYSDVTRGWMCVCVCVCVCVCCIEA